MSSEGQQKSPLDRGLFCLDVAGELKVIRAVVVISVDIYRPLACHIYLEAVYTSDTATNGV